jgi:hypothetical protein
MSFTLTRLRRRVSRYLAEGEGGLLDRSSAPRRVANRRRQARSGLLGSPKECSERQSQRALSDARADRGTYP